MNMEGEGLSDIRDHFRRQLVQMGVIKPTDEEAQQMQAAGQQQDPNAVFLQAAAEEAMAKAAKANADVVKTIAESELTQAKTAETLMKIDGGDGQAQQPRQQQSAAPEQMSGMQQQGMQPATSERELLELEAMQIQNEIKRRELGERDAQLETLRTELASSQTRNMASDDMQAVVERLGERVEAMDNAIEKIESAMGAIADVMRENADRAFAAMTRPKRFVRERGRIVGIEMDAN
jgi:hypothetical protein